MQDALVEPKSHNPKAAGSNPAPATNEIAGQRPFPKPERAFVCQRFVSAPIRRLTRSPHPDQAEVGFGRPWWARGGRLWRPAAGRAQLSETRTRRSGGTPASGGQRGVVERDRRKRARKGSHAGCRATVASPHAKSDATTDAPSASLRLCRRRRRSLSDQIGPGLRPGLVLGPCRACGR